MSVTCTLTIYIQSHLEQECDYQFKVNTSEGIIQFDVHTISLNMSNYYNLPLCSIVRYFKAKV